jgi:hypothetical protein
MLERELKALRQEIKKTKKDADKAEKVDKVEKSEPVQGPSKRPWSRAMH